MIPEFIIGFRESLEAALIAGIILSYLAKTNREKYNSVVYLGITAGIIASIIGAFLFEAFAGGFAGGGLATLFALGVAMVLLIFAIF